MERYDVDLLNEKFDILGYASEYTHLEYRKNDDRWWGICPLKNHLEKTPSFSLNQDKGVFYCFGCGVGGKAINLIMGIEGISFNKAVIKIVESTNLKNSTISESHYILKKWNKIFKSKEQKDISKRIILSNTIMDKYEKSPIKEWIDEGIPPSIIDKYDVRYDNHNHSIVFPIWNDYGDIISISSRTLKTDYKELNIPKYTHYMKIDCNDFLYGFWQNKDYIKEKNEILIFEGAKSVMKAEHYGYNNSVAILSSNISDEQIQEIIFNKIRNVVFCLDKEITYNKIKSKTKLLRRFSNVSMTIDKDNLLKEKMSPVDAGKDIWENLYNKRIFL